MTDKPAFEPGWLKRQLQRSAEEFDSWPAWKRDPRVSPSLRDIRRPGSS